MRDDATRRTWSRLLEFVNVSINVTMPVAVQDIDLWHKLVYERISFCIVNIVRYLHVITEFLRDIARMRDDEWQTRIPVQNPCTYSTIVINDYNETHGVCRATAHTVYIQTL